MLKTNTTGTQPYKHSKLAISLGKVFNAPTAQGRAAAMLSFLDSFNQPETPSDKVILFMLRFHAVLESTSSEAEKESLAQRLLNQMENERNPFQDLSEARFKCLYSEVEQ